jgi:SP family sugar:H+ symporter-like MFS transporter
MFFMPESPRWLLSRGRKQDSLNALRFIAGKKNRDNRGFIEAEYEEIEIRVNQSKALGKAHFWDAFNPKGKVLYRTMLGITLQALQQLTGANYFFYYGASIFQAVGISNSYVTQIILGGVNVICTFPGLWFIERFGRRMPLLIGGAWQCAWLVVFAAVGSELDPNAHGVGAVLITSACMFIAGYFPPAYCLTQICSDMGSRYLGGNR